MEFETIKQTKNPFMKREEYSLKISADSNPTKKQVLELIKADEELSVVRKIDSTFGKSEFGAEIFVYKDKESKAIVEIMTQKERKKIAEAKKKEEEAKKKAEEEAKVKAEAEKATQEVKTEEKTE